MVQLLASLADLEVRVSRGPLRRQHALVAALLAFADCRAPTLRARASDGLVVDAHGDLRPEHVYLTTPPRILDRLEFGAAHRAIDWLEDVALLAVDLEAHGHGWIGDRVERAVAAGLGDAPPPALWCFYRGWRALLRAQLAVEHLARADGLPRAAERQAWLSRARSFLGLARRHIGRLRG